MECVRDLSFGNLFRQLRLKNKKTLRGYCKYTGLQPGNISKIERNLLSPPSDMGKLMILLEGLEFTDLEFDFLLTAAQNYHIAKVIARF